MPNQIVPANAPAVLSEFHGREDAAFAGAVERVRSRSAVTADSPANVAES